MRISDWSSDVCSSDLRADIKQQSPNGAEIVRQQIAELLVQIKDARAHREKMLPAAQLHLPARQLVIAIDDRRVERRDQRGMQEVEEIGDRWSQAFDVQAINGVDSRDNLFSGITARAMIQQPAKNALVHWVFIDEIGTASCREREGQNV